MEQNLNQHYDDEIPIKNNRLDELNIIELPDKWWSSQNYYEMFSKKNVKILDINSMKTSERDEIEVTGWDIRKGDFMGEFVSEQRILTKKDRVRVEKLILFGFLVLVAAIIILISYGIAETIRW